MRQADKKYFGDVQQGRLNADDSPFVVGTNEWINAENVRTGSTDKGFTGIVESVGGNAELPKPPSARAFFFNIDEVQSSPSIYSLGDNPSNTIPSNTKPSIKAITDTSPLEFITNDNGLGATEIQYGEWNIYCNLANCNSTTTPRVYANIYLLSNQGTVLNFLSQTNKVSINTQNYKNYNLKAQISQQSISSTDRIIVYFIAENLTGLASYVGFSTQSKYTSNWHSVIITNINNSQYEYTNIGSVEDTENNRILYFNYDNSPLRQDKITCLDLNSNKQYNVILSAQVRNNKYLRTEYVYSNTYTLDAVFLGNSSFYNMVFSQSTKTIKITASYYQQPVDINLNIGDVFWYRESALNNKIFTVENIVRETASTTITVLENVSNETNNNGVFYYLNQLYCDSTNAGFLNFIQTGFKIEILNSVYGGEYIITDCRPNDGTFYLSKNTLPFIFGGNDIQIKVYSPIIIYENGLNFYRNSLIHSAKISNGNILSWVDGESNEPRKINIESGILANDSNFDTNEKIYEYPLNFSEISIIKCPPSIPPIIEKTFKSGSVNLIRYDSFEFAFQFVYNDNEVTVPGTYSFATKLNNTTDTQQFNAISVSMSFQQDIPSSVKEVNLICRISDGNPIGGTNGSIIYKWQKSNLNQKKQIEQHNDNLINLNYIFYNDVAGEVIPSDDVLRPFDNVPIFSQTHEVSKSRYFLANNITGYDTPKETSLSAKITNQFKTSSISISITAQGIKIGYYREKGNNWSYVAYYIYINNIGGNRNGYYRIIGTEQYHPEDADANQPGSISPPVNFTNLIWIGNSISDIANNVQNITGRGGAFDPDGGIRQSGWYNTTTTLTGFSPTTYATVCNNSKYRLGIVFYDYAMRKCGVCINNNNPQNYYKVISGFNISTIGFGINKPVDPIGNYLFLSFSGIQADIIENDIIFVTNSIRFNGVYTVAKIYSKYISSNAGSTQYILQISDNTVPSHWFANESCTINVYRNQGLDINSPIRDYNYITGYGQMEWDLNNLNNKIQIPEWAYYYSIVKTLNLKTRFFLESRTTTGGFVYVTKDVNGTFNYSSNRYSSNAVAIGISTQNMNYSGLGYTYSDGDMCDVITENGVIYNIAIIGQESNYIHLQVSNLGVLPSLASFRIYTPYKSINNQEPYYEISQTFEIINPRTDIRRFSQLNGIIPSDSFILQRNSPPNFTYYSNSMSPNDVYWKRWDSDAGKTNIVTVLGKTDKNTNITWSDTYISGTQINGSSTFRLGSETFVSDDCGSINKLQLTSKVQDQGQGSVMLALCNSEINSMYLGETQIADSTGKTQFFSASTNVISTINILKGNYGCINPESVVQYRGKVYFVDISNGRVIQYSDNGLDAISNIKMSRFWKNWAYKYKSMTKAEIEDFGDRPFIFSAVDSGHDELLISLPKLSEEPPKGYLPDYPNTPYPFDILDYQGKTMVYCLGSNNQVYPHWQGAFTFTTENFVTLQNRLFSFKNGKMYEHNQDFQNLFYGIYSPSKIMFTSNILSQVPKVYDNFVSESNLVPNFVYFYNNYPYIQTSDLDDTSFVNLEGIWYANILRNKIVPSVNAPGYTTDGLLTAEVMRNKNMYVETRFSPTTTPLELRLLQLGTTISKGHIIT